jgi:hypothetical protein
VQVGLGNKHDGDGTHTGMKRQAIIRLFHSRFLRARFFFFCEGGRGGAASGAKGGYKQKKGRGIGMCKKLGRAGRDATHMLHRISGKNQETRDSFFLGGGAAKTVLFTLQGCVLYSHGREFRLGGGGMEASSVTFRDRCGVVWYCIQGANKKERRRHLHSLRGALYSSKSEILDGGRRRGHHIICPRTTDPTTARGCVVLCCVVCVVYGWVVFFMWCIKELVLLMIRR